MSQRFHACATALLCLALATYVALTGSDLTLFAACVVAAAFYDLLDVMGLHASLSTGRTTWASPRIFTFCRAESRQAACWPERKQEAVGGDTEVSP